MAFAGLWERWEGEDQAIESCTIIVTAANDIVRPVHDRMPVIIDPADYALWMSPEQQTEQAGSLLRAYPSEQMEVYPVSRKVNSPANNDPGCIAPIEVGP
jgi:putative SOS response-associated peptidase YedK